MSEYNNNNNIPRQRMNSNNISQRSYSNPSISSNTNNNMQHLRSTTPAEEEQQQYQQNISSTSTYPVTNEDQGHHELVSSPEKIPYTSYQQALFSSNSIHHQALPQHYSTQELLSYQRTSRSQPSSSRNSVIFLDTHPINNTPLGKKTSTTGASSSNGAATTTRTEQNTLFSYDCSFAQALPKKSKGGNTSLQQLASSQKSNKTQNAFRPPPRRYISGELTSSSQSFGHPTGHQNINTLSSSHQHQVPQRLTSLRSYPSLQSFHTAVSELSISGQNSSQNQSSYYLAEATSEKSSHSSIPSRRASLYDRKRFGSSSSMHPLPSTAEETVLSPLDISPIIAIYAGDTIPNKPPSPKFVPQRVTSAVKVSISDTLDQGLNSFYSNNFTEAMLRWNQVLDLTKKEGDIFREIQALGNIGCLEMRFGILDSAFDYLMASWQKTVQYTKHAAQTNAGPWLDLIHKTIDLNVFEYDQPFEGLFRKHSNASIASTASILSKKDPTQGPPILVWYMDILYNLGNLHLMQNKLNEATQWYEYCSSLLENTLQDFPLPPEHETPFVQKENFKNVEQLLETSRARKDKFYGQQSRLKLSYLHKSVLTIRIRLETSRGILFEKLADYTQAELYHQQACAFADFYITHSPTLSRKSSVSSTTISIIPEQYEALALANYATFLFHQGEIASSLRLHIFSRKLFLDTKDRVLFAKQEVNIAMIMNELAHITDLYAWSVSQRKNSTLDDKKRDWASSILNSFKESKEIEDKRTHSSFMPLGIYLRHESLKKLKDSLSDLCDHHNFDGVVYNYLALASTKLILHEPIGSLYILKKLVTFMKTEKQPPKPLFTPTLKLLFVFILSQTLLTIVMIGDKESSSTIFSHLETILESLDVKIELKNWNIETICDICQLLEGMINIHVESNVETRSNLSASQKLSIINQKGIGALHWLFGVGELKYNSSMSSGSPTSSQPSKSNQVWCDEGQAWFCNALNPLVSIFPEPSSFPITRSNSKTKMKPNNSLISALYQLLRYHTSDIQDANITRSSGGSLLAQCLALAVDMIEYAYSKEHIQRPDKSSLSVNNMLRMPEGPDRIFLSRQFNHSVRHIVQCLFKSCANCTSIKIQKMEDLIKDKPEHSFDDEMESWMDILLANCHHV